MKHELTEFELKVLSNITYETTLFSLEQKLVNELEQEFVNKKEEPEIQEAIDKLVELELVYDGIEEVSDDSYYYVYDITEKGKALLEGERWQQK